jgi:hypothetical protein
MALTLLSSELKAPTAMPMRPGAHIRELGPTCIILFHKSFTFP